MLSTQAIKNTGQASHYFLEHDNYYKEEKTLGQERSQWWRKGADILGLSGHVATQTFTQLLLTILNPFCRKIILPAQKRLLWLL